MEDLLSKFETQLSFIENYIRNIEFILRIKEEQITKIKEELVRLDRAVLSMRDIIDDNQDETSIATDNIDKSI